MTGEETDTLMDWSRVTVEVRLAELAVFLGSVEARDHVSSNTHDRELPIIPT
jgi:hypothetical protein